MDSGEGVINPVAMTIINPQKEYWLSRGSNQQPHVLKPNTLLNEVWGSAVLNKKYGKIAQNVVGKAWHQVLHFKLEFQVKNRGIAASKIF